MFEVTTKAGEDHGVRAKTIEGAARQYARAAHGSRAVAMRTTGSPGLSGWFQAYLPCKTGGLNSTGEPFHVWEPPVIR